jgi:hydrogenase nickel incorporation protein HypA/HybF
MHELSITEGVVRVLQEQAASNGYGRVLKVHLEVGALSSIEPDSLEFCFDVVTKGTIAEGAALHISRPKGKAHCNGCGTHVEIGGYGEPCTGCGTFDMKVVSGQEVRICDIEVE